MRLQYHVIGAVFKRNFISYFSNPIGYLFITAFVLASGWFAFCENDAFFTNNLADLEPLNQFFPYLLLFFVPAITMAVWAEERKTGTEELLLTLPASDLEIVLGKFFSCLATYSLALFFSFLCHLIVLKLLGSPDMGLLLSTYLGYWLIGGAMLAGGMMASLFSGNVTVSFIWGVAVCLAMVSIQHVGMLGRTGGFFRTLCRNAGIVEQFEPFSKGLVTLGGLFYFFSIIVVMLYMNVFLLGRRHWGGSIDGPSRWCHNLARAAAIVIAAVSLTLLADRSSADLDFTEERIHSLSPDTKKIIASLDAKRPVMIEAFLSQEVPQEFVETRRNLIDLLRQFDSMGGEKVRVRVHQLELFSEEAREAARVYEIRPQTVRLFQEGRQVEDQIFLGLAFKCSLNQKTIPFLDRGLPIEYEITRLIRTVSEKAKRKVGVMTTDANLFASFMMMRMSQDWEIVTDLRQQYDVVRVTPSTDYDEEIEALIVPMASSLKQDELDRLIRYIKDGRPTLIFDDPMPMVNPQLAAAERLKPQNNQMGMFGGRQPPPEPKGNLRDLLRVLNIDFDTSNVVNQTWNPHPQLDFLRELVEIVFIGKGSGAKEAFNPNHKISSGLQEVVLIYPGGIERLADDGPEFSPLLETSRNLAGTTSWNSIFIGGGPFGGRTQNPFPSRRPASRSFVLAAHIHGPFEGKQSSNQDAKEEGEKTDTGPKQANVVFIADLDMISDQFFGIRKQGGLQFDNVNFVLNCVDFLVGDESFIRLRKKQPKRRTLDYIERMAEKVKADAKRQEEEASIEAQAQLDAAQGRLDEAVDKIEKLDLPPRIKEARKEEVTKTQRRAFEVAAARIESEKQEEIKRIKENLQMSIRSEQQKIKLLALLLPPIPALIVGLMVFFARISGEKEGVDPKRLV